MSRTLRPTPPGIVTTALVLTALIVLHGCGADGSRSPVGPGGPSTARVSGAVRFADGRPAAAAGVSLGVDGEALGTRITGADGRFVFNDVAAGDGRMVLIPPAGARLDRDQPGAIPVRIPEAGEVQVVLNVTDAPDSVGIDPGQLAWLDLTALVGDAAPVGPVYLTATSSGEPARSFGGATDGAGRLHLALPAGSFTLSAVAPAWYEVVRVDPASITVTAGQTGAARVDLRQTAPLPAGGIEIVVMNPDSLPGEPVVPAGVAVTVTPAGGGASLDGRTDATGRLRFDVDPGDYDVAIAPPAGWELRPGAGNPQSITVTAATDIWVGFPLRPNTP